MRIGISSARRAMVCKTAKIRTANTADFPLTSSDLARHEISRWITMTRYGLHNQLQAQEGKGADLAAMLLEASRLVLPLPVAISTSSAWTKPPPMPYGSPRFGTAKKTTTIRSKIPPYAPLSVRPCPCWPECPKAGKPSKSSVERAFPSLDPTYTARRRHL